MKARTFEETKAIINLISLDGLDRHFLLMTKGDGFLLQVAYYEADIFSKKETLQKARKWYISPYMTVSEIVRTAHMAVQTSYRHVVDEHFLYKGVRVFSPHPNVEELVLADEKIRTDARTPPGSEALAQKFEDGRPFDPRWQF